jgi:hypothetical protein
MECFTHAGEPAVGTCRACTRGVCRRCAVDLRLGLACAGRCEEAARGLIAGLEQSVRLQTLGVASAARTLWFGLSAVGLLVGGFVLLWGASLPRYREIALLGLPFLMISVLTFRVARGAGRAAGTAPSSSKP